MIRKLVSTLLSCLLIQSAAAVPVTTTEWVEYFSGVLAGMTIDVLANLEMMKLGSYFDRCIPRIVGILEYSLLIYFKINDYFDKGFISSLIDAGGNATILVTKLT